MQDKGKRLAWLRETRKTRKLTPDEVAELERLEVLKEAFHKVW
jgi:hypothetical protein